MTAYIKQVQKKKLQNRNIKRARDLLPLDKRLEYMISDEGILTKPQYDDVKELMVKTLKRQME